MFLTKARYRTAYGAEGNVLSTGFGRDRRDSLYRKAELQRAVVDCGFEHPSDVQQKCIPEAILGVFEFGSHAA